MGMPPGPAPSGTSAEQNAALAALLASIKSGAAPTAHNATAPADQKYVAWFEPNGTEPVFMPNPNYDANAPKLTVYGSADAGYFRLDNQGNPVPVSTPNADATIEKAVDRQIKEGERNARQRNFDTTGFYGTDAERATFENNARARGLDADRIGLDRDKFNVDARQKDAEEARLAQTAVANIAKTGAEITQLGATTARTGAETSQIGAQTAALQAKTPSEIQENLARAGLAGAQTDMAKAQADEVRRKAGLPTIEDLGTGATYGVMSPTGQVTEQYRQGYVPKTLAEVQARIGQIDALAQQKKAEVMAKRGPGYTDEQAFADFTRWHEQNVQPHVAGLEAALDEAALTRGKDLAATRTAAYTSALGAGTLRQRAVEDQQKRTVSPAYLEQLGKVQNATMQGKRAEPIDYSQFGRPLRDVAGESERAVAEALKYIDPTAAQLTGTTAANWQATRPSDALALTRFMAAGGGGPAAAGPVAGPPPSPVAVLDQPRADQISGATPMGNALASGSGLTGTVNPGDQNYLGMTAEQADAQRAAANAQTTGDLQDLMSSMEANDVYQYGGGSVPTAAAAAPRVRRVAPVAPAPMAAPGGGYDPSNIPLDPNITAPGFGYDPSSFGPPAAPGFGYDPSSFGQQFAPAAPAFWPVPDETYPYVPTYVPPPRVAPRGRFRD